MLSRQTLRNIVRLNRQPITYTRKIVEKINVDVRDIVKEARRTEGELTKEQLYKMPFNDRNPQNLIKVKINNANQSQKEQAGRQANPAILPVEPKIPRKIVSANKKYMKTSLKKQPPAQRRIKAAVFHVKRIHVCQAIHFLASSHKKVAKLLGPTFYNLLDHASKKGMKPYRMFVHGLISGKTRRFKGIRYHAKMKMGRENKDICGVKVMLYEMPREEFFRRVADGRTPAGLASDIKERLESLNINSQFEQIRKWGFIITARGRQQMRLMNRRKVQIKMKENEKNGIYVPCKTILKEMLESRIDEYEKMFDGLRLTESSLKLRKALHAKNSEK